MSLWWQLSGPKPLVCRWNFLSVITSGVLGKLLGSSIDGNLTEVMLDRGLKRSTSRRKGSWQSVLQMAFLFGNAFFCDVLGEEEGRTVGGSLMALKFLMAKRGQIGFWLVPMFHGLFCPSSTKLLCCPVFFFLLPSLSPLCRDQSAPLTTVVAAADVLVVATAVPYARAVVVVVLATAALATPLDPPYTSASSDTRIAVGSLYLNNHKEFPAYAHYCDFTGHCHLVKIVFSYNACFAYNWSDISQRVHMLKKDPQMVFRDLHGHPV